VYQRLLYISNGSLSPRSQHVDTSCHLCYAGSPHLLIFCYIIASIKVSTHLLFHVSCMVSNTVNIRGSSQNKFIFMIQHINILLIWSYF